MHRRKDDARRSRATAQHPRRGLEADSQQGQAPLPLPPLPPRKPPRSGWALHGHAGYYGGVWVCERCGGVWEAFQTLALGPTCAEVRRSERGP